MAFKSGFVTIIGRPNVGKSTLLNSLAGGKVSIISDKPQTTRNTIRSIVTREDFQIVFIDTPGIHKPKNKLGEYMVSMAEATLREVDMILFMVEATDAAPGPGDIYIIEKLKNIKTPSILIINKIDLIKKEHILPLISTYKGKMDFQAYIPVSAINGTGTGAIIDQIKEYLPEGPKYFPDDMVTDQPERMIVSELIREKILQLVSDEIPHGVGVEVVSFKERPGKNIIDIDATIFCEKETHKGILIGKGGSLLKKIGILSREDIEKLLGTKVFLQLWVKVKQGWRNLDSMLKTLGYD